MALFMRYLAVIFDLFGTLADNFSKREYEEALVQMASVLSIPSDDFIRGWYSSSKARSAAAPQDLEDRVEYICTGLGAHRERRQVSHAARVRFDYIRHVMKPRPGTAEVLSRLKGEGYKLGLISDCSDEIPVIWSEHPLSPLFDAVVFSCIVGFRKPDPRIYQLAAKQLCVRPEACVYVGDGGSQELSGATGVGMHPVLIRLDAESAERHLVSREQWDGPTIHSLGEVLTIASGD
jgi:putative hydrolase of the HAD superfamily